MPRRDWHGVWLGAFITSYYQAFMNDLWIEACRQLLERVGDLEHEGSEMVRCMSALVAQQGGQVRITAREVEQLRDHWLARRTSPLHDYVEFRVQEEEPE